MEKASVNPDHYTCAECHGKFIKGWSDEEAAAERTVNEINKIFDILPDDEMEIVCDDCYKKYIASKSNGDIRRLVQRILSELDNSVKKLS